jgi:hypothetical protein
MMKPIAPDIKSPLRPPPVGKPIRPGVFMTPDQKEAIQAAKGAKQDAFAAARGMDTVARQAAQKAAQQQYQQSKLGPRTGGDMLPPGLRPPSNRPPPKELDDTFPIGSIYGMKKGGSVKKYKAGGSVKSSKMGSVKTASPKMSSASKRGDGIAQRGKTRGKMV